MDGVMPKGIIRLDIISGYTRHQFDLRIIDPNIPLPDGGKIPRLLPIVTNDKKYGKLDLLVTTFKMETGSGINWFIEGVISPVNIPFEGYYSFQGSTGWIKFVGWK